MKKTQREVQKLKVSREERAEAENPLICWHRPEIADLLQQKGTTHGFHRSRKRSDSHMWGEQKLSERRESDCQCQMSIEIRRDISVWWQEAISAEKGELE